MLLQQACIDPIDKPINFLSSKQTSHHDAIKIVLKKKIELKKAKKKKEKKKEKEKTNKEKNRLNLFYEYVLVDDSGIKTSDHIDEPEIWNIRAEIVFNMVIW